jgi:hypothetical protein
MMGLTDRVEPWARRFQRAPVRPAPEPAAVATVAEPEPEPEPRPPRTGRFARRSTPAGPERPTDRPAAGTTRG